MLYTPSAAAIAVAIRCARAQGLPDRIADRRALTRIAELINACPEQQKSLGEVHTEAPYRPQSTAQLTAAIATTADQSER